MPLVFRRRLEANSLKNMLVDAERVGGVRHVYIHDAEVAMRA